MESLDSGRPRRGMATCSRLCDLISASLLPYIEPKPISLNKETQKDLLLSLSLVSREIHRWSSEISCGSEQEIVVKRLLCHNYCQNLEQPFKGNYNCLANIISVMVAFLGFDNQFVQHSAGNIIVSLSSILAQFGNKWVEFLQLLWISLETSVSNICLCTSSSSLVGSAILADENLMHHYPHTKNEVSGTDKSISGLAILITVLQSRSVNVNSIMVAGLFQVLRSILKSLKQDSSDLEGVFAHLAVSSLLTMPWDILCETCVSQMPTSEMSSEKDGLLDERSSLAWQKHVLSGTVLQLFCSLVEQKDIEDIGGDSLEEFAIYSKFTNLVPKLLSCFSKHLGCSNKCLSQYLKHKVLVLMIRLSFYKHWQSSCPILWLKLLAQYFEDLLYECILECDAGFENSLDGSPFLVSFVDGDKVYYPRTRNLQRQAIFLFFRCCFTLPLINKDTGQGCECVVESSPPCIESCCCRGLSELSEWLQRCGFLEMFEGYENYSKSCCSFALSFLQLYVEDDDMLFEMLLQLLDSPFVTLQLPSNPKGRSYEELKRDTFFHFSSIFNPIHLFHLLLLLLHYDYLVLVDYLISKYTGIHCVKYLLRSLRIICESWMVFVGFSICDSEITQFCHKKRKISSEDDCSQKSRPLSSSSKVVKRQNSRRGKLCSKSMSMQTFVNAKECLLSLKGSLEDLHRKNLFPYNPKPLLRSFSRFQELCKQEEMPCRYH